MSSEPDKSTETRIGSGRRRRAGRPRPKTGEQLMRDFLQKGGATPIMLVALVAYLVINALILSSTMSSYGNLWIGATPTEVRYAVGAPTQTQGSAGDQIWTYAQRDQVYRAQFAQDGLERYSCRVVAAAGACPEILAIRAHAHEGDLINQFGSPSRAWFVGDMKYVAFKELGLTFALSRDAVLEIGVSRTRASPMTKAWRYMRVLLP